MVIVHVLSRSLLDGDLQFTEGTRETGSGHDSHVRDFALHGTVGGGFVVTKGQLDPCGCANGRHDMDQEKHNRTIG
ncbi:hypothetical protein ASPCAL11567 [Aspergillus calidoustus]|uniref:Uncharacterized protein n=1 Tax=Aspergillus calidoustus TaxID=454130 RepID=A0A0U5G8K9_ASPCI|nr:hypothetical protein ASPCAL11567 [Aspergillus calidoustus]